MTRKKINENGRTMTEILGILAIMGVLSVTALMGYNIAIIKYKTNQIINEVNNRGVVGLTQMISSAPLNLSEFPATTSTGHLIALGSYTDTYFDIVVEDISQNICTEIAKNLSTAYTAFINDTKLTDTDQCPETSAISFRFLKSGPFTCPDTLGVCQAACDEDKAVITLKADGTVCKNSEDELGYCQSGICVPNEKACLSNQDCKEENTYCKMENPQDCLKEADSGTCTPIPAVQKEASYNGYKWKFMGGAFNLDIYNWWSGNNLCQAMGLTLPLRSDLGEATVTDSGETVYDTSELTKLFPGLGWIWTSEEEGVSNWGCLCAQQIAVSHGGYWCSNKINNKSIFCLEKETTPAE